MKHLDFMRRRFETAKLQSKNPKNAPQLSQIRIAVPFEKGKTVYGINIKDEKGHKLNRILKDNDLFVVAGAGMGIMVEDTLLPGHAPVLAYPLMADAAVTAAGQKGLVSAASAYVLYNGQWSLRTNQDVNYQAFPTNVFLRVPEVAPKNLFASNIEDSIFEIPEEITLNGQQDHEIRVEIPGTADTDIKGEAGSTAYLVFFLLGWTIQGAAK